MDNNLGERLKQRRLELDLSQLELARRAKVSQGTIAQLEIGRNQGSGKILDIAIALNVSPEWLLYGKTSRTTTKKALHENEKIDFCIQRIALQE